MADIEKPLPRTLNISQKGHSLALVIILACYLSDILWLATCAMCGGKLSAVIARPISECL